MWLLMRARRCVSLLIRQILTKEDNSAECAGLCGDRELGLIEVTPDLHGYEANEQAEDDPKRW